MLRGSVLVICYLLLLGPAWSASAALVGWWPFDETSGTVARDASGQGNDGTILGTPAWAPGKIGGALQFNGSTYVNCGNKPVFNITDAVTLAAWVQADPDFTYPDWSGIIMRGGPNIDTFALYYNRSSQQLGFKTTGTTPNWFASGANSATALFNKEWHHVAATYDGTTKVIYMDGAPLANAAATGKIETSSGRLLIGAGRDTTPPTLYAAGKIDDAQIYDKGLAAAEILSIMEGLVARSLARDPSPQDAATDVPGNAVLSWTAGEYPATHDVYVGTTFADVNNASRTNPKGLLASEGQTDTMFDPAGSFAYGQTYYWRIDEVNKSPDNSIFKGTVWSFTTEPYGYPVKPVAATASSAQVGMGPEKTIDGSGLTGDLHGTDGTTMWLSTGAQPNWIQYQFDKVYKLFDLKVWNSNGLIESFIGFGAKKVTIEYSADGTTWTALANVPEFARAPGIPGYAANTTVSLGGVMAKYVKLTINGTWGGVSGVTGLSEVRFSYVPVQAFAPQPATAATGVSVNTSLNWRPGREAASHKVYFGTDPNAVAKGTASAKTTTEHTFDPGALNLGTTYYWKVDEVNAVTYPGDLWSFTTQEFAVVDDFESYNDTDNRIFDIWVDGWVNGTGAQVGYTVAPFAERTILHGGKQSMPLDYNNTKSPYYSEASQEFSSLQNWTSNGVTTLSLWYRGYPVSFVDKGNSAFTVSGGGNDIWNAADAFRFAYKKLSANGSITARVDSQTNTNAWAKAGVMIRETLDAGSAHALMVVTPSSGASFQRRTSAGGTSANTDAAGLKAPYWVRMTRTGNVFKAEVSADGKTWTQVGTDTTIPMAANVYVGLAVTSHDIAQISTAGFSNVAITGGVSGLWQAVGIGSDPQMGNSPDKLYLAVEDSTGKVAVVTNPDSSAVLTTTWTQWKVPLTSLTGVNAAKIEKMYIGVGDRKAPVPAGAGRVFIDDVQVIKQ